jgi:hypothetical protein
VARTGYIQVFQREGARPDTTGGNAANPCLPAPEADAGVMTGTMLHFTTTSQSGPEHESSFFRYIASDLSFGTITIPDYFLNAEMQLFPVIFHDQS